MNTLPNAGDIIKCTKSVTICTNDWKRDLEGFEEKTFQFVAGELYTIYNNEQIHVTINTNEPDRNRSHHGGFVEDTTLTYQKLWSVCLWKTYL